jgi:hypothetical protein
MNIEQAISSLFPNQGFTYSFIDGSGNAKKGFYIPVEHKWEKTIKNIERYTKGQIRDKIKAYALDHMDHLNQPNRYLGAWVHDGQLSLHVSELEEDELVAAQLCKKRKQVAYYDNRNKKVIYLLMPPQQT